MAYNIISSKYYYATKRLTSVESKFGETIDRDMVIAILKSDIYWKRMRLKEEGVYEESNTQINFIGSMINNYWNGLELMVADMITDGRARL